jgi:2,4-dienoyl-CoA reductase-like NADH-dependent reductase (Old Yellow Enzyme family)/thioredoxin reductase
MEKNYSHVFSPITIKGTEFKNRIEAAPTLPFKATPDGVATPDFVEYYRSFARSGAAIVTVGESTVSNSEFKSFRAQLNLGRDEVITGLDVVHEGITRYNTMASIELNHNGHTAMPGEITEDQIYADMRDFADAAHRCTRAGFKMIMVHGGHGHLLAQFLSPLTNKRRDRWGGTLENRARFPIAVLDAIRQKCGPRLIIEYRISLDEKVPGGIGPDEVLEFLTMIEDRIDIVHVSAGMMEVIWHVIQPQYMSHMCNVRYAEMVKRKIKLPVTVVGSIMDLENSEKILSEGHADFIAMARPLLADPDMIRKTALGKSHEIRPCIRCNMCSSRGFSLQTRCTVNPITGRGLEFPTEGSISLAGIRKKILIAGGGPAGMQAALTAVRRGHEVVLYEMTDHLGGMLENATALPFKEDLKNFLHWQIARIKESGITVIYNTEVTADIVRREKPDFLVIAVGATPLIPAGPGGGGPGVYWAGDIDIAKIDVGEKVIVVGGGLLGVETALFFAQQRKQVTIIEMMGADDVLKDASIINRFYLLDQLKQHKVQVLTGQKMETITGDGIRITDGNSDRKDLQTDTVILAMGMTARKSTVDELRKLLPHTEVAVIGDCYQPRNLFAAIHDGFNMVVEV